MRSVRWLRYQRTRASEQGNTVGLDSLLQIASFERMLIRVALSNYLAVHADLMKLMTWNLMSSLWNVELKKS